ncbi:hypothetical protein PHYBOEH_001293 [Phytophthora boehmeriae]|uniref:Uncharacterized protein n=1 Tax=Phytophthora boehmeriae TaxID=109152 RepID=A0A8T1WZD6_9STRA|nr:hypothetical protein PHYBOEH_001293 [Phytophthora boehmeriae]
MTRDVVATALRDAVANDKSRRERQRERMVNWRRNKKAQLVDLNHERQRLERELQLRLASVRTSSASVHREFKSKSQQIFHQVTVETAALKSENLALQEALAQNAKFEELAQQQLQAKDYKHESHYVPPVELEKTASKHQDVLGWRVFFPNDEPSFHFYPFSKAEFENIQKHNGERLKTKNPCVATVGKLFGWTVDYAPLSQGGSSLVAHARFSRHMHCSLDHIARILPSMDKDTWPVAVAPRSCGRAQSGKVCVQTLQSFETHAHVLVCNIPGDVHLRYIAMARYSREEQADGKRVDTYAIVLVDADPNTGRSEDSQTEVQWIKKGGTFCTFTEVDETSTDVVYHHWAGCLNESLGRELYIDWIRFAVLMEQYVSPARLLAM